MGVEYHISIPMLDWIADRQATDRQGLAWLVAPKRPNQFLDGIVNQTQAECLIKLANIPFGFLFLQDPPSDNFAKPALPDFRTIHESDPLSDDFYDVLNDVLDKQDWYRDYLRQIQALPDALPFVGKFGLKDHEATIAEDIATTIGFDVAKRNQHGKDEYFRYISGLLENVGILVMKSGIVGSNTRRTLNVREFRGLALADKQVPVIFINGADAAAAQLFTLLHEASHIWLGKSGVSNPNPNSRNRTEKLCNRVAAEFLVPSKEFQEKWQPQIDVKENLNVLAQYFRVSSYVIAIKALQNKLIRQNQWQEISLDSLHKNKSKGSGGNPYATIPVRNSKRLTEAVARSAMSKEILLRDGARLLNITPNTLAELYRRSMQRND